jgi:thymidylate synthase ThyX
MDRLFETNQSLLPKLSQYLQQRFPDEKPAVIEKKAFDTLRGLLPSSTLSQVAFFGNGQAFEYLIARSRQHPLGEVRWAGEAVLGEIAQIGPSFVRRLQDETRQESTAAYEKYLGERRQRMVPFVKEQFEKDSIQSSNKPHVDLLEADPEGETKVIAGMLYSSPNNHRSWSDNEAAVRAMTEPTRRQIIESYLEGREQRWQKVGRAFENSYVRFEITMNIGGWRDLQRHRMLSQQRQSFSCHHGYDLPIDLVEAGLDGEFRSAIEEAEVVFTAIEKHDPELAQYATTLAHRMRFVQLTNLRSCFWEMELRTIPEGHPDYRWIEQEKFRLLQKAFPLITEYMHVNMENYDFARRGQEERIAAKLKTLVEV